MWGVGEKEECEEVHLCRSAQKDVSITVINTVNSYYCTRGLCVSRAICTAAHIFTHRFGLENIRQILARIIGCSNDITHFEMERNMPPTNDVVKMCWQLDCYDYVLKS